MKKYRAEFTHRDEFTTYGWHVFDAATVDVEGPICECGDGADGKLAAEKIAAALNSQPQPTPRKMFADLTADAVAWIAENDAPGDDQPPEELAGYISVLLAADLLGEAPEFIAAAVWRYRHTTPEPAEK